MVKKDGLMSPDDLAAELLESYNEGVALTDHVVNQINLKAINPAATAFMLEIVNDLYQRQLKPGQWAHCKEIIQGFFKETKDQLIKPDPSTIN